MEFGQNVCNVLQKCGNSLIGKSNHEVSGQNCLLPHLLV